MTVMSDALSSAGFDHVAFQVRAFLMTYYRSGGSERLLLQLNDEVKQMLGIGHISGAVDDGERGPADLQLSGQATSEHHGCGAGQDDAEADFALSEDQVPCASASSANGAGHERGARKNGPLTHARPVAVEQSESRRAVAARNAKTAATTIMDTLVINGNAIGDYSVGVAKRLGRTKSREGYILLAAARHAANAKGSDRIRDVVSVSAMQKIVQQAAEYADAA